MRAVFGAGSGEVVVGVNTIPAALPASSHCDVTCADEFVGGDRYHRVSEAAADGRSNHRVDTSDAGAMAVMYGRDERSGRIPMEVVNRPVAVGPSGPGTFRFASAGRWLLVADLLIQAVQHVRRMHGGAQSHLMRCADGFYYVVKFQNNPQHTRVLVNDWLGTRLAEMVGLPVPVPAIVNVHPWLLERTPDLRMELCGQRSMFTAGLSFGSRFVVTPGEGKVLDYLSESNIEKVRNIHDFAGVLALDKWTCNANGRQVAFWKKSRERKLTATFIDQGYCFNAGEWTFPDAPLRGVFGRNDVYACVTSWDSFEPWLSRIENFPESSLWPLAEEVPPEWYGSAGDELERMLQRLLARRSRVRELILGFKNSSRNPFPNWRETVN